MLERLQAKSPPRRSFAALVSVVRSARARPGRHLPTAIFDCVRTVNADAAHLTKSSSRKCPGTPNTYSPLRGDLRREVVVMCARLCRRFPLTSQKGIVSWAVGDIGYGRRPNQSSSRLCGEASAGSVPLGPAPYAPKASMSSKCGSTTFISSTTIRGSRVSSNRAARSRSHAWTTRSTRRNRRNALAGMSPSWAGDGLPGRRRGERLRLASRRLNHGSDWIISELITCEHGPSLVAINACQQQRGEAVPHHDVLNQLAYRDLRRRRPIPCVCGQLTHDPFELR